MLDIIKKSCALLVVTVLSGCALLAPIAVPIADFFIAEPDACDEVTCKQAQTEISLVELNSGEGKEIEVCACRQWNDSGIKVAKGEKYIFEITEINNWQDGSIKSDPKKGWIKSELSWLDKGKERLFSDYLRTNKTNLYVLVGTIGKTDDTAFALFNENFDSYKKYPACEKPYIFSNHSPIEITKPGILYFYANDRRVNDKKGYYFNNKGKLKLCIINVTPRTN